MLNEKSANKTTGKRVLDVSIGRRSRSSAHAYKRGGEHGGGKIQKSLAQLCAIALALRLKAGAASAIT